jgi:hypothetical protein
MILGMTPSPLDQQASSHRPARWVQAFCFATWVSLTLFVAIQLQQRLDNQLDRNAAKIEELAQLPSGEYLKPALLGYHHLGADILWVRLLQVLGKKRNTADEYEWIYHVLDVITTLDPQYDYPYYVGGVVLTNLANRVDLSNKLLEKGFKENPTVWNLPFLLGYNHYFILGNSAQAANYIAEAARLPGGPSYLSGLATRMYAESNNPDTALQFLESLLRQTQNAEMRVVLENRTKEVVIERDIRLLELAVARYQTMWGRIPSKLYDLIISGILPQIPQEPFGGSYELDALNGAISSSTHPDRLKVFRLDKEAASTSN